MSLNLDIPQLVIQANGPSRDNKLPETLILPPLVALTSIFLLLVHVVVTSRPFQRLVAADDHDHHPVTHPRGLWSELSLHVNRHGGWRVFAFKLTRLVGCLTLLCLSMVILIMEDSSESTLDIFGKHRRKKRRLSKNEWYQACLMLTFLYSSFLALVSVTAQPRSSKIAIRHLNTVLLSTLGVYFYRDIFPLMTFTLTPRDLFEGGLLWAKIIILFITSVFVPLAIPRVYVPVDPKNPMPHPSPEQTASIFSMAIYHYLNPLVFTAYRQPHLPFSDLPPLSDRDASAQLRDQSFKHLDTYSGAKKRHLFLGLMRIFRMEYTVMSAMILLNVFFSFAGPIGINRLLHYLESKGEGAVIRPFVWISWLFLGPIFGCVAIQWYIFIATRTLVRADAILTQLVFEHALRIRVQAESGAADTRQTITKPVSTTPDSVSDSNSNNSGDETLGPVSAVPSDQETVHSEGDATPSKPGSPTQIKKKDAEPSDSGKNLVGKINNLVSTDLLNITNARDFLFMILYIPAQIILCIVFLYYVLGWSAFVGLAVIIIMFPVPGLVAKLVQTVQETRLKRTDARIESVTEAMNVLRMIKLFGWERKINERIASKREDELVWIKYRQFLELLNGTMNFVIPVFTMAATFATYVCTVVMDQELSASKVFSSLAVFEMLRDQLHMVFYSITESASGLVSLNRLGRFLRETELLDSFSHTPDKQLDIAHLSEQSDDIGFRHATFAWFNDFDGTQTPSRRRFLLKIEDQLWFKNGVINLIVGSTGSGKTSILHALLGEMHFIPSGPDSSFSLPRHLGIAYAAQESWVLNETIRDNIVFGSEFDEPRYKSVLKACQLELDLKLFAAGDQTEVGERGQSLSGGQRARITLARAVYSSAKILLLDDVFAALDVHTSRAIVEGCFKGPLVQGRTVLLVTHNIALTGPIADYIVVMSDGGIRTHGSPSEVFQHDSAIAIEELKEAKQIAKAEEQVDTEPDLTDRKSDGKLIVAEEIEEGHISWHSLKLYLVGLGGDHPGFFFSAFLGGLILVELSNTIQTWFLGYWAAQYEKQLASEVNVFYYLGIYGCLLLSAICLYSVVYIIYVFGALRASRSIHMKLMEAVMGTTLRWLDTTPTSRVITRATQDIRAVDGPIPTTLFYLLDMTLAMSAKFGAVVIITPIYLFPGIFIGVIAGFIGQVYIKAQLSVKREMSNVKSPVIGHLGAAIAGLVSIRAYGVQQAFKQESLRRIDSYVRASRTYYNLNRWVCIRIESAGGLFAASLAAYLVYFQNKESSTTGFSLNMAVGASGMILWWVRVCNEFEVQGNSLERIQGYIEIEQEPKPTVSGQPPASWPRSGQLIVENLSARYSPDGPKVLHDLSFKLNSGERIGVVGRTGSGKSSLTLSLLRCIYTEGSVYYDGLLTTSINLDALRAGACVIPQVPELLSGSLRQNLDPFDQHDDAVLNDALRSAGLFALQSEMDQDNVLHLDSSISSGGSNLSIGQRQILALARAIVRGSKLLILDEATSAIDYKTDAIIQSSLRNELGRDVTLITVAHRLQTVMDADRIMVLDAGKIVEFDSPRALLKNKQSRLSALVDQSADKETLYAIGRGSGLSQSTTHYAT